MRTSLTPLAFAIGLAFAWGVTASEQQPSTPAAPPGQAPDKAVLADSEVVVIESGGIAGRVHSVRLSAAGGRVDVEYRAPEVRGAAAPHTGTVEPQRYLALWRALEATGVWTLGPQRPARGADLVQFEVRLRRGGATHVVRWDEASAQTKGLRELWEAASGALALGREATISR